MMYALIFALLISGHAFAPPKTTIIRGLDGDVTGTVETETISIQNGKIANIQAFGCAVEGNSIVLLQWGSDATTWNTLRGCAGGMDMKVRRDFQGNGTKKFKIVRINVTGTPKNIVAWLHVLIHDQ